MTGTVAIRCPGCGEKVDIPVTVDMVRPFSERMTADIYHQFLSVGFRETTVRHKCPGGEG